tara:strand:+ start:47 stop:949 length:903 start_codon:yes stop_codon:yes gene_type:complete
MNNMKLIMESWKNYVEKAEAGDSGTVFLFEGSTPTKTDFNLLLERYNNKELTGEQLINVWQESVEYEYQQLLTEIDWEKEAELTADPGYKPPQERGGIGERISEFVLEKSVQLVELAKAGVEKAAAAGKALLKTVGTFQKRHPLLFKVVSVVVISVAIFALMSVFQSGEAEASIKAYTAGKSDVGLRKHAGGRISSTAYEALRGLIYEADASLEIRSEAMKVIDAAQQSGDVVDLAKLATDPGSNPTTRAAAEFAAKQLETLEGMAHLARKGDVEASGVLMDLLEIGKKLVIKIKGAATR